MKTGNEGWIGAVIFLLFVLFASVCVNIGNFIYEVKIEERLKHREELIEFYTKELDHKSTDITKLVSVLTRLDATISNAIIIPREGSPAKK